MLTVCRDLERPNDPRLSRISCEAEPFCVFGLNLTRDNAVVYGRQDTPLRFDKFIDENADCATEELSIQWLFKCRFANPLAFGSAIVQEVDHLRAGAANKERKMRPAPQKFVEPPPGTPSREWEAYWHSGMDYIAPDLDPNHPMLTGEAGFVRPQHQEAEQ